MYWNNNENVKEFLIEISWIVTLDVLKCTRYGGLNYYIALNSNIRCIEIEGFAGSYNYEFVE